MPNAQRHACVDALRGLAIVWMTLFHFCFDLNHFGWLRQNFYTDPFWTGQRTLIVSLFLFCAGLGQAIAVQQGQGWPRFWRRWAQVAGCAVLVTAGSIVMFPNSFIYFGVLHGIAVMLLIARLTAGWGQWLWLAGALAIGLQFVAEHLLSVGGMLAPHADAFNARTLNWLGFVTRKPVTEDYVPLVPWLGVMWWGMAAGQWLLQHRPGVIAAPLPGPAAPLAWLGRWSLSWYMLHQPVLIGLVAAMTALK
ncbi:MAG: heparan-alpha-glucosaminide N-acetyltransferase [Pseudomonadota bacterium]